MRDFGLDPMMIDELGEWAFAEDDDGTIFYLCLDQDENGEYSAVIVEETPDGCCSEISLHVYANNWENLLYKGKTLINSSGVLEPEEYNKDFDYDAWIASFIRAHESSGTCSVDESITRD